MRDAFSGTWPYNRLRVLNARSDRHDDAIRACHAAIDNVREPANIDRFRGYVSELASEIPPERTVRSHNPHNKAGGEMSQEKRKVIVVTDAASSLTQEMGREHGVHVVPSYISFGTQTYRDGVDLHADQFYRLLRASKEPPTTSQPAVADFERVYAEIRERMVAEQTEAILSIHPSVKMSATVNSALAARKKWPDVPIHVIDCRSISMGLGLIVIAAARAANEGQDVAEVVGLVEKLVPKMNVIFTVETLHYLHKGGRIGGASALLGSVLGIKPILHVEDGRVEPLEKPRTRKRALRRLLDLMDERLDSSTAVHAAVLHCDAPEAGQALSERIGERFSCAELRIVDTGPVIGTHAGPGTVGVAFYAE